MRSVFGGFVRICGVFGLVLALNLPNTVVAQDVAEGLDEDPSEALLQELDSTDHGAAHSDTAHATPHAEGHAEAAHAEPEGFNVQELLFHHLIDTHDWHFFDVPAGNGHYHPVHLRLPWIVYSSQKGLEVFTLSGHDHHELEAQAHARGYGIDHYGKLHALAKGETVIDFSISKLVLQLLLVGLMLLWVFGSIAKAAQRRAGQAPKGAQSLFEPIILFIRDEVARVNLRDPHRPSDPYHYADRMTPYLLTAFFFIWFANLFGLTPLNSNIAGNIAFTTALTLCTFLLIQFNGSRDYWQHIFWYPGVATPIKFLMLPVELIGIFTKPLALAVRLFANITGGHIAVLALISLIFIITEKLGPGAGWGISVMSVLLTVVVFMLEMIVAIVQAYIFTLLTAVFIGMARERHAHDDHHGPSHDTHTHAPHGAAH